MNSISTGSILREKREKFAVSIRKQKNEIIFAKKREKYLTKTQQEFSSQESTSEFDLRNIDQNEIFSYIIGQSTLSTKMANMKKLQNCLAYISKNNSHSSDSIYTQRLITIVPSLLNLLQISESTGSSEMIDQILSLLINITFFLNDSEIEKMIEQSGFASLFQLIQSTDKEIQTDSIDLLLNIFVSLSQDQISAIIQKFNLFRLIINSYTDDNNQVSARSIKGSLKLMIQCLVHSSYNFPLELLEDTLDMAISIVEKEDSTIKHKILSVRLMIYIFRKIENKDRWIKTSLKSTLNDLLNMQNYLSTQIKYKCLVEQTLSVMIILCTESDQWIISLIKEGLLHTLMYLIQNPVCDYQRVHQKIIQLCCLLFFYQFQNEETDKILNNQQDLVENILQSLNYVLKQNNELPIYSLKLITILTLTDRYLEQVLSSINYFKIMCIEIQRHDFIQSDRLDLTFWLKSIEGCLLYGINNNEQETYIGQFLMYDGEKIIDVLQQTNKEEIILLTQKILSMIE